MDLSNHTRIDNSAITPPSKRSQVKELYYLITQSKSVLIGGIFVLIVVLCAIFAPLISTHDPYEMNMK